MKDTTITYIAYGIIFFIILALNAAIFVGGLLIIRKIFF